MKVVCLDALLCIYATGKPRDGLLFAILLFCYFAVFATSVESAELHRVCFFFLCNISPKASSISHTLLFIVLGIPHILSMGFLISMVMSHE